MISVQQTRNPGENAPVTPRPGPTAAVLHAYGRHVATATYADQRTPSSVDWWGPGARAMLRGLAEGEDRTISPEVIDSAYQLRGLDFEIAALLHEVEEVAGERAARRAILLTAAVMVAWLDAPTRVEDERAIASALAAVNVGIPFQFVSDEISPLAIDAICAATGEDDPQRPGVHWLAWYACDPSPLDGRWACTCALRALGDMLDALDTDRRLRDDLDALARFLRTGDLDALASYTTGGAA